MVSSNQGDYYTNAVVTFFIALSVILWFNWVFKKPKKKNPPLPPGPRGLPLIGNLLSLEPNLPSCLAKLSKPYGPIIKIKIGTRLCIVINSASVAKEVLKDHDTIFANRDISAVAYAGSFGGTDLVWSPLGDHWRMLRKICVRELLSSSRLDALYDHRRKEVRDMVNKIYLENCKPLNIGDQIFLAMFSVMSNMMWGGTLQGEEKKRFTAEFREVLESLIPLIMAPNISDLFPVLAMFDIQGLARKMKNINKWFAAKFDFVIDRRLGMKDQDENKDFLQVLLQFKEYGDQKTPFTTTHIKGLFLDMLGAGTKSSSSTVEWAMSELLIQPELLRKAQEELEQVVGIDNIVEESHCSKLHFLNAIVKETLRLHPVGPLLVPRCPTESCIIGGYMVPKGAKIFVNGWAIQRDPACWDKPLEFKPERFLGSDNEYDFIGSKHSYIPFGSGRRVCVGIPMAERMIPYLLASLLHSFNWKMPEGTTVDLSETFGLELRKTIPLIAIPTPRLSNQKLYM
ncbi:hypothetical protein AQUCO_03800069v1 [Aquilegia coerulea]|uniref:Cytochrome P450 n=1 Tax=Aquilegia coerulea TaxID=218851 RepID=A0A2G5CSH8_AQUCA|nr:hypothetical protein AQUCO_03800069v1 [Aquilegia coerulea]